MNKTSVPIKGMHCRSCELLVEDELLKVPGIVKADVNHRTGSATVFYKNDQPGNDAIASAIEKAGYVIGHNGRPNSIFSHAISDYWDIVMVGVIAFLLYLVGDQLGIFRFSSLLKGGYGSLTVVFLVGITAGLSTCMALVGGLVLGISARFAESHPEATSLQKFTPHIYFNLGRIIGFAFLGGVAGYVGSLLSVSTGITGVLTILVGMVMLVLGMQLTGLFPVLDRVSFTLPKGISRMLGIQGKENKAYSAVNSIVLGALTFFLPCGFTQAMQLFAVSSKSPLVGALTMGVFVIGTAPGLLGVGGLTSLLKGGMARMFFKFAGIVVIVMSVFNMTNGLNLARVAVGAPTTNSASADPNVTVENGVQVIRMKQTGRGYVPNEFTVKQNMPVAWKIMSEDPYSCASSLVVPDLKIRTLLTEKEQEFKFTPKDAGDIRFTCSMGMYSGVIHVSGQ